MIILIRILILNLYPVRYYPSEKKVSYFTDFEVIVKILDNSLIQGSGLLEKTYRGINQDKLRVEALVDNADFLSSYP